MEGETGKMYRASFHDRQGRVVLILRPGMQVTWLEDFLVQHFIEQSDIFNHRSTCGYVAIFDIVEN